MSTENKITTHFQKGLIIGLALVAIGFVFQIMNIYDPWVQWVTTLLYAVSIIWSCFSFSKEMNAEVSFGQVFSHGFKTASIVILISIAAFALTYVIMPEIKTKALEIARKEMEKDPRMTEKNIQEAIKWTDQFFFLFGIVGSLFGLGISGAISSLIGAAVVKKNATPTMPKSL
jgi:hypothetical protein